MPIPIVDPTDIFGIVETNTSVTIPAAVIAGVSNINFLKILQLHAHHLILQ